MSCLTFVCTNLYRHSLIDLPHRLRTEALCRVSEGMNCTVMNASELQSELLRKTASFWKSWKKSTRNLLHSNQPLVVDLENRSKEEGAHVIIQLAPNN